MIKTNQLGMTVDGSRGIKVWHYKGKIQGKFQSRVLRATLYAYPLEVPSANPFCRLLTALDKSSEWPALLYILTSRALIFPFIVKPT